MKNKHFLLNYYSFHILGIGSWLTFTLTFSFTSRPTLDWYQPDTSIDTFLFLSMFYGKKIIFQLFFNQLLVKRCEVTHHCCMEDIFTKCFFSSYSKHVQQVRYMPWKSQEQTNVHWHLKYIPWAKSKQNKATLQHHEELYKNATFLFFLLLEHCFSKMNLIFIIKQRTE